MPSSIRSIKHSTGNVMTEPTVSPPSIEPLKLFNEFQSQLRARLEASLKLIMILSGGMLTLSVGAVLGNSPPRIPAYLFRTLSWSWGLLFFSIAAATVVMAGMIAATSHMGFQWRKRMQAGETPATFFVAAWAWLRVANAAIGVLALLSFLGGLVLISQVAIGVARSTVIPANIAPVKLESEVPSVKRELGAASSRDSQQAPPPGVAATTAELTETSRERAAKALLDKKLVDFNGDLAFYTLILAVVAALQFGALAGQVVFLRLAFKEARRGGDIARDAMIAGERAFVFGLGVQGFWNLDSATQQYHWRLRAQLRNSGDTPTRNTQMHSNYVIRDTALPPGFDFDYPTDQVGKALLAPHVDTMGGIVPRPSDPAITPQDILDVQAGTKLMYVWGWVKYSDVFPNTPRHITRFCWQVTPLGDPLTYSPTAGGLTFPSLLHSEGNCVDDECDAKS
jgi:hypothetical protein